MPHFVHQKGVKSMFKALYFGAAEKSKMTSKMVVTFLSDDYEGSLF